MWKRRKWRFVCVLTGKLSDYKIWRLYVFY
nr:MAG TPA: hypothetical protein [Caudoviricetes sp.]